MPKHLRVRVIPNAARDEIVGLFEGFLKIKLQAVPEDGRANRALCRLLAEAVGCRPREVTVVSGQKSRLKVVELPAGVSTEPFEK